MNAPWGNGQPTPRSAYEAIKAMTLRRVEAGDIDPQADAELVRGQIAEVVGAYQRDAHLDDALTALADPEAMVARVMAAVCDLGPLTGLLARGDVEEIMIQGAHLSYITADGRTHFPTHAVGEAEYRQHIERLLQATGRQLDASTPIVVVGLDGRTRLSVKIPPVADELTVCIRRQVLRRPTLRDLIAQGSLSPPAAGLLWALMQIRSRVLVAGAPFAGKTTLLNALLAAIPAHRVVRVNEEARELSAPLMLGGYCQASDRPGQTLRDLVRADLTFRPDMLVVGEVKGAEAYEVIRPLNAGTGFMTSVHCNAAADAIDVLTACAAMAGEKMDPELIRSLFAAAIDVIVFVDADEAALRDRDRAARRQVTEIAWVEPQLRQGRAVLEPIFRREALGRPLTWTGARPHPDVVARLDKGLAATETGVTIERILEGDRPVEALR
jgi:pilus assembly protein CpaF